MSIICDGCNVRGVWEHRCHGAYAQVRGETIGHPCECRSVGCPGHRLGDDGCDSDPCPECRKRLLALPKDDGRRRRTVHTALLSVCAEGHVADALPTGGTAVQILHRCGDWTWEDGNFCVGCGERLAEADGRPDGGAAA